MAFIYWFVVIFKLSDLGLKLLSAMGESSTLSTTSLTGPGLVLFNVANIILKTSILMPETALVLICKLLKPAKTKQKLF